MAELPEDDDEGNREGAPEDPRPGDAHRAREFAAEIHARFARPPLGAENDATARAPSRLEDGAKAEHHVGLLKDFAGGRRRGFNAEEAVAVARDTITMLVWALMDAPGGAPNSPARAFAVSVGNALMALVRAVGEPSKHTSLVDSMGAELHRLYDYHYEVESYGGRMVPAETRYALGCRLRSLVVFRQGCGRDPMLARGLSEAMATLRPQLVPPDRKAALESALATEFARGLSRYTGDGAVDAIAKAAYREALRLSGHADPAGEADNMFKTESNKNRRKPAREVKKASGDK